MGQKVNPTGIRLGVVKDHASVWYADKAEYSAKLLNDLQVRKYLDGQLKNASVSRIEIESRLGAAGIWRGSCVS